MSKHTFDTPLTAYKAEGAQEVKLSISVDPNVVEVRIDWPWSGETYEVGPNNKAKIDLTALAPGSYPIRITPITETMEGHGIDKVLVRVGNEITINDPGIALPLAELEI